MISNAIFAVKYNSFYFVRGRWYVGFSHWRWRYKIISIRSKPIHILFIHDVDTHNMYAYTFKCAYLCVFVYVLERYAFRNNLNNLQLVRSDDTKSTVRRVSVQKKKINIIKNSLDKKYRIFCVQYNEHVPKADLVVFQI